MKRAYLDVLYRKDLNSPVESHTFLGWQEGPIGIVDHRNSPIAGLEGYVILYHIPSSGEKSTTMAFCMTMTEAKRLAKAFVAAGCSEATTLEEVYNDPLWDGMKKVYQQWRKDCYNSTAPKE